MIGVDDHGKPIGIAHDGFESDDLHARHVAQVVLNGLGDRAGTSVDPVVQRVNGVSVCLVSCKRSPEPVRLTWKGLEKEAEGDFYVRNGPRSDRLEADSAERYVATRFEPRAVGG